MEVKQNRWWMVSIQSTYRNRLRKGSVIISILRFAIVSKKKYSTYYLLISMYKLTVKINENKFYTGAKKGTAMRTSTEAKMAIVRSVLPYKIVIFRSKT